MRGVFAVFSALFLVVAVASAQPLDDDDSESTFEALEPVPPPPARIHELRGNTLAMRRHGHHFHARRAPAVYENAEEGGAEEEETAHAPLRASQGCRGLHHENLELKNEVLELKRVIRMLQKKDITEENRLHAMEEQRHELKKEMERFSHAGAHRAHPRTHAGLLAHQRSLLRRRLETEEGADASVDANIEASTDSNVDSDAVNQFPIVGTMAGLYSRFSSELPSFGGVGGATEVDALKTESKEAVHSAVMAADLQKSREDLGKAEEEKQHLQDRVSDLEGIAAEKENDLSKLQEALRVSEEQRQEQVQQVQLQNATQQGELEKELVDEKAVAEQAKAELSAEVDQKDVATKELSEKLHHQEGVRQKLEAELHQELTGEGQFAAKKFENERVKEEETLKSSAQELQSMEGAEGKCMSWGKRLEVKLQHVLKNRQNDARLCRDGILSLHEERSKLKKQLQKKEADLEASRKEQAESDASSAEDQMLLSKCLDRVSR